MSNPTLTLVIGDKRISSWSMRPWVAMKQAGIAFAERLIELDLDTTQRRIREHSPSGRVPVLHADFGGGRVVRVWDSLAILEYVAELFPRAGLWPEERDTRAVARSVSAEMHSGFAAMRRELSMDIGASKPKRDLPDEARADVARVMDLLRATRKEHGRGGPFLFGATFGAADAMYAPVMTRFVTYDVAVDPDLRDYQKAVLAAPGVTAWIDGVTRV